MTFRNVRVLVTGAGFGIGAAISRQLAVHGARVWCADVAGDTARAVAGELKGATGIELDVRDVSAFRKVVDGIANDGGLDYIFNNAGIGLGGHLLDCEEDDFRNVLDVNLFGVWHGVAAAYPHMVKRGQGHIVNVASLAGVLPSPGAIAYATSKHAVVGMTLSLRAEARGPLAGEEKAGRCPGQRPHPRTT